MLSVGLGLVLCCGDRKNPVSSAEPPDSEPTISVELWDRHTVVLEHADFTGNPFELSVEGIFTNATTDTRIVMPGYFAGNGQWKIKFMPTEPGEWSYETVSSEPPLNGITGRLMATPSMNRGMLRADFSNPKKWRFENGPYVVPIALRTEFFAEPGTEAEFEKAINVLAQSNVQLLETRLTEEFGLWEGGRHDYIFEGIWEEHRFDLRIWNRMDQRMEALANRVLGAHLMFYSDDAGKPGWGGQTPTEELVIRYAVARLAPYPVVIWNTGIDIAEYRSESDVDWFGRQLRELDPYDHPLSSRRGGGSGSIVMDARTFESWGDPIRTRISPMLAHWNASRIPVSFDDAWGENMGSRPERDHAPEDIRRAFWKCLIVGGAGGLIRGSGDGLPRGGLYSFHTLQSDWESDQWLSLVNPFVQEKLGEVFGSMEPDPSLVSGAGNYALSDPSRTRIVYLATGPKDPIDTGVEQITILLSNETGTWDAIWFDPRNGSELRADPIQGGSNQTLQLPSADDWILWLAKQ